MSDTKYACIDLDGTIAHYQDWKGETHFGDPISGVQEALKELKSHGWKIIIFTTRGNNELVAEYLNKNKIPFDYVNFNPDQPDNTNDGKPIADVYIDDRAIQFNGDWPATIQEALVFSPWEQRNET